MKKLKAYEIRQMWLDFFKSKGHEVIPSASLIPQDDPTLLWINAGVAPLKKYFDGREKPENPRLTNAQKSLRTNDIDNVGRTARHHTFFEMLGNFSVGDYFRDEVLPWACELLFDEKWFALDKNLIYITYYTHDLDTFNKWKSLGIEESHLIPLMDNFWEIGEGPCGPDTEIFFDRGEKYDPEHLGLRLLKEDMDNDRYIEIWNIVFSQFNSQIGKKREEYKELPSKNIDTGCGLERLACIFQETETNYETDLFMPYIKYIEEKTNIKYTGQMAFKVIVDHIRSICFALADGAVFGNSGRGYVLRRILRRAVRYMRVLNVNEPFLYNLVDLVALNMKEYYPYLQEKKEIIKKLIKIEEENFLKTLANGEKKLNDIISNLDTNEITGSDAFLLYDTFGFPIELTQEIAAENNINVDLDGFKVYLTEQKNRARMARGNIQSMNMQNEDYLKYNGESNFVGYEFLHSTSYIDAIFSNGKRVKSAKGDMVIVTKETPFYAESGGQVGDIGLLTVDGYEFNVLDTFKLPNGEHAMVIDTEDFELKENQEVALDVDPVFRSKVAKNHSATHILNQSLRNVLGGHVVQQGSLNNSKRLRFDFNHYSFPTLDEILKIEKMANEAIQKGYEVKTIITSLEEAKKHGAQALFGEKYGKEVRMVDMDYCIELCGGTHVKNSKDINKLVILSIESKGSGIYRIEAATDDNITQELSIELETNNKIIKDIKEKINDLLKRAKLEDIQLSNVDLADEKLQYSYIDIINKREEVSKFQKLLKSLEKEYEQQHLDKESKKSAGLFKLEKVNDIDILVDKCQDIDINVLKENIDNLANTSDKCFIFMADIIGDKIIFVAKSKNTPFNAGMCVKEAAIVCGGNGGGRPDFAQAGGRDITKVDEAISLINQKVGK